MGKDVKGSGLRVIYVNLPAFPWSDGVKLRKNLSHPLRMY